MRTDAQEGGWRAVGGLAAASALAASIQIVVAWRSPVIAPDGIVFVRIAQSIDEDAERTIRLHSQHPGFPVLVNLAHRVMTPLGLAPGQRGWIRSAQVVSSLNGILGVVGVWLLARSLWNSHIASGAALLFAALPVARENAADALGDSTHALLFGLAAWTACSGLQRISPRALAASGALAGLAFLVRPEGLVIPAACTIVALGMPATLTPSTRGRLALGVALMVLMVLTAMVPYAWFTGRVSRKLEDKLATLSASVFERERLAAAPPLNVPSGVTMFPPSQGGLSCIPGVALTVASRLPGAVARVLKELCERLHVLVLGCLACIWFGHRPRVPGRFVVLAAGFLHMGLVLGVSWIAGYADRRHMLPLAVLAAPAAAAGWLALAESLHRGLRWRISIWGTANLAMAMLVILLLPRAIRPLHRETLGQVAAMEWLAPRLAPADRVVTNCVHVAFYLERPAEVLDLALPREEQKRILDCMDEGSAEPCRQWYVLDENLPNHFDPAWIDALEGCFKIAWDSNGRHRHRVRIFLREPRGARFASRVH